MPAADLIFEAAGDSKLHEDCLRQLLLNLDHRFHEFMSVGVQLRIDLKDRLFDALRVENDRTVAARDDFLLLSDAFD